MISGSYRIFKNGEEVCESKNLLTTFGKDAIIKYLTNSISSWGDAIAIGVGSTTATVADSRLAFEFARNNVNLKSPNILTSVSLGSSGTFSPASNTITVTLPTTNSSGTSYGGGTVGTVTSQTATVTGLTTTVGMVVGGLLSATNGTGSFGTGTVITSIVSSTSITVSATSGLTAGTVTAIGSSYIVVGMSASGTGVNTSSVITSISGLTLTLSHNNTGTVSGAISFTLRKLLLKASLDPSLVGTIYELGVYTSQGSTITGGFDGKILSKFDEGINVSGGLDTTIWSYHSANSTSSASNSLVGSYNINLNGSSGSVTSWLGALSAPTTPGSLQIDLTGYTRGDTIQLAFTPVANSTGTIVVTFYDDQPTPQTLVWTIPSTGYTSPTRYIATTTFNGANVVASSTFNYNVSAIGINVGTSGTANISFDALRIDDTDTVDTTFGLVSRSVLSTPITKALGDSLDIQYELTLGL